jgi:hypothetical protein
MSDFFSFEYFDEAPVTYDNDPGASQGSSRKNQSLSLKSTEVLREAMRRLVPTNFVYGESGIGERAYELYGMCVSYAFTGRKSCHLIAALCVMHASYERRSDLVILPSDLERRYADMHCHQLRYTNILRQYDAMCETIRVPRLEVSIEKVFGRIYREGCCMKEADVFRLSQTASRIYVEFKSAIPPPNADQVIPTTKRVRMYGSEFRMETLATAAAILACRFHDIKDVTANAIREEFSVNKVSVHRIMHRYRSLVPGSAPHQIPDITDGPAEASQLSQKDAGSIPNSEELIKDGGGADGEPPGDDGLRPGRRKKNAPGRNSIIIGDLVVPSGWSTRRANRVVKIYDPQYLSQPSALVPTAPVDDGLDLLFLDQPNIPGAVSPIQPQDSFEPVLSVGPLPIRGQFSMSPPKPKKQPESPTPQSKPTEPIPPDDPLAFLFT